MWEFESEVIRGQQMASGKAHKKGIGTIELQKPHFEKQGVPDLKHLQD